MLVAIINYGLAEQALALKRAFTPHARTLAFDSGSLLSSAESAGFDVVMPNVFYSGLINAVALHTASLPDDEPVFIWCSDVTYRDYAGICDRVREVFADPDVGIYAPSAFHSHQPQMANRETGGLRRVTFADGFCFATRVLLLRQLCPIDTQLNFRGWGLDVQLGYLACHAGLKAVVDDRIEVQHPRSTGYSRKEARRECVAWQACLPTRARLFHQLAGRRIARHPLMMRLLLAPRW